jgi:hypothetical protein
MTVNHTNKEQRLWLPYAMTVVGEMSTEDLVSAGFVVGMPLSVEGSYLRV